MMIAKAKSGLAVLAIVSLAAGDALAAKDVKISGAGVRKCSEWNNWKAERNGEARAIAVEWALGFVAGHNVYSRGDSTQSLVNPNSKTVAALLDTYCQKRPDDRLLFSVLDMVKSLGGTGVDLSSPRTRSGGESKPEL